MTFADLKDGDVIHIYGHAVRVSNVHVDRTPRGAEVIRFTAYGVGAPLPVGYEGATYGGFPRDNVRAPREAQITERP